MKKALSSPKKKTAARLRADSPAVRPGLPSRKRRRAKARGHWVSEEEISRLHDTLREAQETLAAIRSGEVDAVVVSGTKGHQIYSLTGAEQPYRVYVEGMQEGAVTVSADALILYCNQKFADMIQTPLERVIGSRLAAYLDAEAWQALAGIFQGREKVFKYEGALRRADGSILPANLTANCLPQEEQKIMCLVITDLTQQKKHEELRLAKEVAEKAGLAKDDFLAALSHELRTPLTPVLMTAMALEQDPNLSAEVRAAFGLIRRNVELETKLIDDLLDLTRIAKGKLELHLGALDVHAAIRHAVEICRSKLNAKAQIITLDLGAEHFRTEGDAVRIQQAVWNLVSNAAKFTGQKGVIVIRTRQLPAGTILVEVEDTGIGFEGSADKLFQAFEQGGRQITRQFGGLGLGLAITRSIVEAHHGTMRASSPGPGQGARFGFEIPLVSSRGRPAETKAASPGRAQNLPRKRILLVEDHKDTRTSLELLLRQAKHDVKSAATAEEALRLAAENPFDLVVSDIGLPDQSGLELMQQLKARFALQGIGLSGYGMEEDIAKSQAAGFARHLTKPVSITDLKQAILETGS